ncbi:MAG: fumarate hydratase [Firmicutes bacterium]|nr:fumarate hydratase [Bacillota bacterium]
MKTVRWEIPLKAEMVRKLEVGDIIYLNGLVYTARDMAHLKMRTIISEGGMLPVNLEGGVLFHAGPVVKKRDEGWEMVVVGPTTSMRMEPFAKLVAEIGVKLIIGKGGMGEYSQQTFVDHGMAYLQAAPGCAVKLAQSVEKVLGVTWPELGMAEAMWAFEVRNFGPFVVAMDAAGRSLYREITETAQKKITDWFPL